MQFLWEHMLYLALKIPFRRYHFFVSFSHPFHILEVLCLKEFVQIIDIAPTAPSKGMFQCAGAHDVVHWGNAPKCYAAS